MRAKKSVTLLFFLVVQTWVFGQCKIAVEMNANGTINKTTAKEVIYINGKYTMFSQVKYDGYEYFFIWSVSPFEKKQVKTGSMEVLLDDESTIKLEFFDSYGLSSDSSVNVMYRVSKENLDLLSAHAINSIRVETEDGVKNFILKMHRDLVKSQMVCIMTEVKKEE
jgi:hypothetical protein